MVRNPEALIVSFSELDFSASILAVGLSLLQASGWMGIVASGRARFFFSVHAIRK